MRNLLKICGLVCLALGWGMAVLATPTPSESSSGPSDEELMEQILRGLAAGGGEQAGAAGKPEAPTNNEQLEQFLEEVIGRSYTGGDGQWSFEVMGFEILMLTDERADRMRIMAPVADANDLDATALRMLLEADFDRALDAKYAIWRDTVWAVFVHPLSSLTGSEFQNALAQVFTLTQNYGTSFTSTEFVYGGGPPEEPASNNDEEGQPVEKDEPGP